MSASSTYRDAILEDGCYVLHEVFANLYCGGSRRPDVYLKNSKSNNGRSCYMSQDQRQDVERGGYPHAYDADEDSSHYDVSLLALLIEHACDLPEKSSILQKVKQIKNLRNMVCHHNGIMAREDPDECLDELQSLLIDIIEELEEHAGGSLYKVKHEVRLRIQRRKSKAAFNSVNALEGHSRSQPLTFGDQISLGFDEMPTWKKVALGLTAGIGAVAIGAAVHQEEQKRKEERKNKNQEEECILM